MKIIDNVLLEIDEEDSGEIFLGEVKEIAENVLKNNKNIHKIEAPSLKKVNNYAFSGCTNLVEVIAPNVEQIGDYAFSGTNIESFDFTSVTEIGKNAFENTHLENLILPKSIKKIGKNAFADNVYLVRVQFLPLMTKIKDEMFANCINLKEFTFSNTINKLGIGVFKNCRKLNQIILPEHLKVIETNAFWNCEGLSVIKFNDELEIIGDYAFGNTKIAEIILPNTIKNVGKFPFHMCYKLEKLKLGKLNHDEVLDKTNSSLKELILDNNNIEFLKPIVKVVNYNKLIAIRYNDDSFQIFSKPVKYYSLEYFSKMFANSNLKMLMKNDEIFNIFYWESILGEDKLSDINPWAIVALPPNINTIKAFYSKHHIYDKIIANYNIDNYNSIIALIKFITIFGGLCKKNSNINDLIEKIGIRNITKQFRDTKVREFNQKFVNLYLKMRDSYNNKEISEIMPFLYNKIEQIDGDVTLDTLEKLKFFDENKDCEDKINIIKTENVLPNYEWLDASKPLSLLWGYILASTIGHSINSSEGERKVLTYYIRDEQKMIVASSRAYYSVEEKYLLFNSIVLSQSFINKGYSTEKIKDLIIEYVLASIEETINFLNEDNPIVAKVHVALSEKSIKEQLLNRGTKIINQNI